MDLITMLTVAGGVILAVALIAAFRAVGIATIVVIGVIAYLGADYAHLFWELAPGQMIEVIIAGGVLIALIENGLSRRQAQGVKRCP